MPTRMLCALFLCLGLGLAAGPAQAADPLKRPGDFRDLAWGAAPDSLPGLTPVERDGDIVHYERKGEKQELGGIPLRHVTYSFYKNKFYHAEIDYDGKGSYEALQNALVAKDGPPDATRQKTDQSGHTYEVSTWNWSGHAFIGNRHDKDGGRGRIFYFYAPLTDALEAAQQRTDAAGKSGTATAAAAGSGYTVKKGDSLDRIAKKLGVTEQALSAANGGLTDKGLKAGAVINVPTKAAPTPAAPTPAARPVPDEPATAPAPAPTPSTGTATDAPAAKAAAKPKATKPATTHYTVKSGDVLSKVASRHGIRVADILAANPGLKADTLKPGSELKIPAKP